MPFLTPTLLFYSGLGPAVEWTGLSIPQAELDREWHWKYKCDIDWIFRPAELYMIADVAPHLGIPNHDFRERVVSDNDFRWVEVR